MNFEKTFFFVLILDPCSLFLVPGISIKNPGTDRFTNESLHHTQPPPLPSPLRSWSGEGEQI
jgi:hypothetical protein